MRSVTPKVLHRIGGRSLVDHAVTAARGLEPQHLVVVVRHERDAVIAHLAEVAPDAVPADQDEVPGTGHLVLVGRNGIGGDLGEVGDDGVALVAHNDDEVLGLQPPGRGDGVVHEAATADPVQDLGGDRSHTSSLACGHDDDGGGCGWRHVSSSHRFAPGPPTSPAATGRRPGTDSNGF